MSDEIREWLCAYCEAAPHTPSSRLKQEVQTRFGVDVSQGHINLVRAQLGVSRPKKSRSGAKPSGKKAPGVCSC